MSALGVYPSMYWGRHPLPCGKKDRQVQKHNLSATSFADGNKFASFGKKSMVVVSMVGYNVANENKTKSIKLTKRSLCK